MSVPLSDTRPFGVVFDRPDADRNFAWGPFAGFDTAARFAEFVEAEIDPAHVIPWADAQALPGVRVADPVAELLTWRTTVALPIAAELAASHAAVEAVRKVPVRTNEHGDMVALVRDIHAALADASTPTSKEQQR